MRVLLLVLALLGVAYAAALAVARNNMEVWHTAAGEGLSSVGRALPLQGRCQEFDSPRLHKFLSCEQTLSARLARAFCALGVCSPAIPYCLAWFAWP